MKKIILLIACLFLGGCAGHDFFFKPDTAYMEQATYEDHSWYSEYGVSGEIGKGIRLNLFVVPQFNITDHENKKIDLEHLGGGFRLTIPIK